MEKKKWMKMKGSKNLRARLLLSTLSSTPILIDEIRSTDINPGLRPYEVSLLRLIEKICDDCSVVINETGTQLKYKPGIVMGGKCLEHNCGLHRSIGYFLEVLVVLALFGKRPLQITLKGITNDSKDPSVDTFRSTTFNILKRFGVSSEGLALKIESRGVPPLGGGHVVMSIPILHTSLTAVNWTDEGMVERIRGVFFSTRSSFEDKTLKRSAGDIFSNLLPNVKIDTDHRTAGAQAANSPGFGVSLVAKTTSGCCISVDTAVHRPLKEETAEMEDDVKVNFKSPADVGVEVASALLGEIEQGGVVDSTHQLSIVDRRAMCNEWNATLCPVIDKRLVALTDEARSLTVVGSFDMTYEVQCVPVVLVDIVDRTCTCIQWQINGLPCSHGVACILNNGRRPLSIMLKNTFMCQATQVHMHLQFTLSR